MNLSEDGLLNEAVFKTSRSGGAGGQHVNKVATKVEIKFDIMASVLLNDEQKDRILKKLSNRLSSDNCIRVVSQEARSQLANKQTAVRKLYDILIRSLKEDRPRKKTKPKRSAIEKRLKEKQLIAQKKITRRRIFD